MQTLKPGHLEEDCTRLRSKCRGKTLRDRREIHLPKVKSTIGQSTFTFTGAKDWNELPNEVRLMA